MKSLVTKAFLLLAGGLTAGFFFASGTANATPTDIYVGGNTDCTSAGIVADYQNAGEYNYAANNIPIPYGGCDGSFAPFVGSVTPGDAIAQSTAGTQAAWDANCANSSDPCRIIAFSLGDPAAANVGNAVGADQPGSNTHVITSGNGWGEPGLLGDGSNWAAFAAIGAPIVGVPQSVPQVSGSENRNFVNDFWGTSGVQNPVGAIAEASTIMGVGGVPPQHAIPHPTLEQPSDVYVTDDGVTQEIFQGSGALPGVVDPAVVPDVDADAVNAPPAPAFQLPDLSTLFPPAPAG